MEGSAFGDVYLFFMYEISWEPLNGFVPNSHGRCVWSLVHLSTKTAGLFKTCLDAGTTLVAADATSAVPSSVDSVADRPRPRLPSEALTLSTNHGGVAIVCVPGVRLSVIKLGVLPSSFKLLCVRVESGSSKIVVALIYRPGSEDITSTFFDDLSETLDRVAVYRDPVYIVGT